MQLAQTLIRSWFPSDFDFAAYEDRYREKLQELIEAKVQGREIVVPEEEEKPEVINLMDALKKSIHREHAAHGCNASRPATVNARGKLVRPSRDTASSTNSILSARIKRPRLSPAHPAPRFLVCPSNA